MQKNEIPSHIMFWLVSQLKQHVSLKFTSLKSGTSVVEDLSVKEACWDMLAVITLLASR